MKSRFYTPQTLGEKRTITPEGYMVCHDVPIARTGTMLYAEGELPLQGDNVGEIRVERNPDEVFCKETIASFEGKPVTLDHPEEFVNPTTHRELAVGVTQNVRRGTGVEDDYLFADLVLHVQEAIDAVNSGLREVSCGYEADYEQTEPGRGVQRNIIGNHVALVERGRCGPRCAIGDHETMTPIQKQTLLTRLSALFKDEDPENKKKAEEKEDKFDSDAMKEAVKDAMKPIVDAMASLAKNMDDLSSYVQELSGNAVTKKNDETEDDVLEAEEAGELNQSGAEFYTGDTIAEVKQALAIVAPDLSMPTFDAKASAKTVDAAMCGCQRKALMSAAVAHASVGDVKALLSGVDVSKLSPAKLHTLFMRVTDQVSAANNKRIATSLQSTQALDAARTTAGTVETINAANRKHWQRA